MSSPSPNSPPLADSLPPEASASSPPPDTSTSSPPPVAFTSNPPPSNASSTASSPAPALTIAEPPSSTSAIATPSATPKPNATADSPAPSMSSPPPPPPKAAISSPPPPPPPKAAISSPPPPSPKAAMSSPPPPVANLSSSVPAPSPSLVLSPPPPLTGADPPSDSAPPVSSPPPADVAPPVSNSPPLPTPPPSHTSPPPPNPPSRTSTPPPPPPSHSSPPPPSSSSPPPPAPPPPPKHRKLAPQPQSSPSPVSAPTAAPPSNSSMAGTSVILAPTPSTNAAPPITSAAPSSNATPPVTSPSSSSKVPSKLTPRSSVDPPPPPPNAPTASGNSSSVGAGLAIGLIVGVGLVGLLILACCLWRKWKRMASAYIRASVMPSPNNSSQKSSSTFSKTHSRVPFLGSGSGSDVLSLPTPDGLGNSKSCFTYEELEKITNGFSSENLLGEGGFGCVYKGCLLDGREVAVKQLKVGGSQGEREFRAEVETISRIHHRHLVSLVGYCIAQSQRLLVYDYVPNNTLYFHLHDGPVMDWATRVKVATGSARGIAYLHEDCHPRIIHRDIKSSNILLDNDFEAKVSDFGLAKLALDTNTHVTTRVMGTFGYMAPEYASSGKLTDKSDVFSFGVVLLELITGCKPLAGDQSLFEWVQPFLHRILSSPDSEGRVDPSSKDVKELVDPRLETNYVADEMFQMMDVAAACIRRSAMSRPRMGQVSSVLDSLANNKDLSNRMSPDKSEIFQDSAYINSMRRMAFGQDYSYSYFEEEGRSQEWTQ